MLTMTPKRHRHTAITIRPEPALREALLRRARKEKRRPTDMLRVILEESLEQSGDYVPPPITDQPADD